MLQAVSNQMTFLKVKLEETEGVDRKSRDCKEKFVGRGVIFEIRCTKSRWTTIRQKHRVFYSPFLRQNT